MTPVCASPPKPMAPAATLSPLRNICGSVRGPAMPSGLSSGSFDPFASCQRATACAIGSSARPVSGTPTTAWICRTISGV